MANPDDPEFDSFVNGIFNTLFTNNFEPDFYPNDDKHDKLLHISESEEDSGTLH